MYAKKRKINPVVIAVILILLAAVIGGAVWFYTSHIFAGGKVFARDAEILDLRGTGISVEEYETLKEQMSDSEILWDVPFQGKAYPNDTTELTITTISEADLELLAYLPELAVIHAEGYTDYAALQKLQDTYPQCQVCYTVTIDGQAYAQDATEVTVAALTEADLELLAYLPQVTRVNADGCRNYDQLKALYEQHPDWQISYQLEIGGKEYDMSVTELTLEKPDMAELAEKLMYLPKLEKVMLVHPDAEAETLLALRESYPEISIQWQVEVLGVEATTEQEEIDISALDVDSTDVIGEIMEYFPDAEKVYVGKCQLDNDTLAAYREEKRADYKVVWQMDVWYVTVRTDDTWFMPGKYKKGLTQEAAKLLRYCEDMICIDIGHKPVQTIEWVENMPNLKYMILTDTPVRTIEPLRHCKELIYLEIDYTIISDYSPLLECTKLEDLNLGKTHGDITPITQMTWLKNLWWMDLAWDKRDVVQEALPNTHCQFEMGKTSGAGWRELQNYYDMRDILGMYYMS